MTKASLSVLTLALWMAAMHAAQAQPQTGNGLDNPDWTEEAAPAPPTFSKDRVIPLDMPSYVSVKVGVDPQTIVVGNDGVVRYVAVMTNASGTMNASFEGIRCASGQFKTYARYSASGTWSTVSEPQWRDLTDNLPSKHPHAFARQAACEVRVANRKEEILQALQGKKPPMASGGRLRVDD
jgi:hypothetical protein